MPAESRQYLRAETGVGDEWRVSGICLYAAEDLHHLPQSGLRLPGLDSRGERERVPTEPQCAGDLGLRRAQHAREARGRKHLEIAVNEFLKLHRHAPCFDESVSNLIRFSVRTGGRSVTRTRAIDGRGRLVRFALPGLRTGRVRRNPAQLTPDELKASFVAREDTLAEMLRLIGEQPPGRPCQHVMLIGPRGMGKTTLGLRFLHEIGDTPDLAARWQPVAFYEESYEIGDLADFWLAALRHLTRATNDPRWADRADALARDEGDTERLAAYALSALTDCCRENGKRLILFVENLDTIFRQLRDEREVHALRATLIERPEILLLGSANAVFQAIRGHGEPFYEFFRLFILEGLGREDAHRILAALAGCEGRPEIPEAMKRERGRLETIRRLTGGNPRLLVLACRMLIESPLGSAFEDLERLIDEQTPYFKARIEELPIQARKVFHCLAEGWKPMLAKEVAGTAKLSSSHASAQLRQLVEKGYAREIRLPRAKRARYEVSDRFYNIYYLLRFSRAERDRLERLVTFLGLLNMHGRYGEAEAARRRTTDIEPMHHESWRVLAEAILYQDDDARLPEAEDCARRAVELAPENPGTLHTLSDVLACRGNWTEALDRLAYALHIGGDVFQEKEWPGLTESLIPAVAAGHGSRVKRMMEEAGLTEPMEPLWHATRAELGEELEPLPAEIMETVMDLRQEFSDMRR